jgi:hypothetical protein
MVEIIVAILFLAAGGMALYTGSMRSVAEAAWGAERVMCEGLLNDLVEYYFTLGFTSLRPDPILGTPATPGVVISTEVDVAKLAALETADVIAARKAIEEDLEVLDPAGKPNPSDVLGDLLPNDPGLNLQIDTIKKEWDATRRSLGIKRAAFFREDDPGKRGTLTCVVKWTSRAGPVIVISRKAVVFKSS